MLPLAALADAGGALDPATTRSLRRVAARLEELGGEPEPPARLHGDLWGGNRLVDSRGGSWLIDPAAFGGHREFDLAMMRLFGGFGPDVFDAYAESHPLADGWARPGRAAPDRPVGRPCDQVRGRVRGCRDGRDPPICLTAGMLCGEFDGDTVGSSHEPPQFGSGVMTIATPRRRTPSVWIGVVLTMVMVAFASGCDPGTGFYARIDVIDAALRGRMTGRSMRAGCPVGFDDLRYLTMSYVGFDGQRHLGEMVVHRLVADDVVSVFRTLYDHRFPIRRMSLVDDFGGDDNASMAADNTSAFNCRLATGSSTTWSEHSYGWAIDINPVENPYVRGGAVLPPAGGQYLNRASGAPGVIVEGDVVTWSFGAIGWSWGGRWGSPTDYQHFVK